MPKQKKNNTTELTTVIKRHIYNPHNLDLYSIDCRKLINSEN